MIKARIFSTLAAGAFGAAVLFAAPHGAAASPEDCILSFDPVAVAIEDEMVEVEAIPSEAVEGVDDVVAELESGLFVSLGELDGGAFTVHVDLEAANPGQWEISLVSEDFPVCTGELTVD